MPNLEWIESKAPAIADLIRACDGDPVKANVVADYHLFTPLAWIQQQCAGDVPAALRAVLELAAVPGMDFRMAAKIILDKRRGGVTPIPGAP